MRPLIEKGMVYVATPPLYRANKGDKYTYLATDKDLEEYKKKNTNYNISRFKGLGEMTAEQLKETTIDPAHRTLRQITIEDFASVDKLIGELMGKDSEKRKDYIAEYGHTVNLFI